MDSEGHLVPPEWMIDMGAGPADLSDRDAACLILSDLDYDAQLHEFRIVLGYHRRSEAERSGEVSELEARAKRASGLYNDWAVDAWIDAIEGTIYQAGAHSMAAAGMLAPFVESLFCQAYQGIRQQMEEQGQAPLSSSKLHERWRQSTLNAWDCHFVWSGNNRRKDLVPGIMQMADAVGLIQHMPPDLERVLSALFTYRNKVFHCGFEWPSEERERFASRINGAGWPTDWFSIATTDGDPWVYYLTDTFIRHCLETIERVIVGIGRYCKLRFLGYSLEREETD